MGYFHVLISWMLSWEIYRYKSQFKDLKTLRSAITPCVNQRAQGPAPLIKPDLTLIGSRCPGLTDLWGIANN